MIKIAVCQLLPDQFNILKSKIHNNVELIHIKKKNELSSTMSIDYILIPRHSPHSLIKKAKSKYNDKVILTRTSINQLTNLIIQKSKKGT